jgi:hypothetical protein
MDDSRTVTLWLTANSRVQGWLKSNTPTLGIRCMEHKTSVCVHTGMSANPELGHYNQATVRIRIDNGTPYSEFWDEATNDEALFAPQPIALARRIAGAKIVRFSFTPFRSKAATTEFNVAGLRNHLPELAKACGWQLQSCENSLILPSLVASDRQA